MLVGLVDRAISEKVEEGEWYKYKVGDEERISEDRGGINSLEKRRRAKT